MNIYSWLKCLTILHFAFISHEYYHYSMQQMIDRDLCGGVQWQRYCLKQSKLQWMHISYQLQDIQVNAFLFCHTNFSTSKYTWAIDCTSMGSGIQQFFDGISLRGRELKIYWHQTKKKVDYANLNCVLYKHLEKRTDMQRSNVCFSYTRFICMWISRFIL